MENMNCCGIFFFLYIWTSVLLITKFDCLFISWFYVLCNFWMMSSLFLNNLFNIVWVWGVQLFWIYSWSYGDSYNQGIWNAETNNEYFRLRQLCIDVLFNFNFKTQVFIQLKHNQKLILLFFNVILFISKHSILYFIRL